MSANWSDFSQASENTKEEKKTKENTEKFDCLYLSKSLHDFFKFSMQSPL